MSVTISSGTRLAHFEIVAPLGVGGMGEVYRARDSKLGREVALKVLPPTFAADRERLVRFAQEARSASALNHPNIVTIYEVGQAQGMPYIAMELVDGTTLRELLKDGALPFRKLIGFAAQISDGLAKAHAAGIVHRDLKPENVMLTKDGFVKILDFGLAKLAGPPEGVAGAAAASMTATGWVMGTPGYMSPEQASGKPVDYRSDQFSAGLILYEMATGRRAFSQPTAVQTLSSIIQDDPEPMDRINPKIPPPFRWVVERCLAKDPDERYASTRDLARDLATQKADPAGRLTDVSVAVPAADMATTRTPASSRELAPRKALRWSSVALSSAIAAGLLVAGGVAGFLLHSRVHDAPAPRWVGDLLISGETRVFSPQVSPDGNTLAFLTPVGGVLQLAVMKPESGDWVVLTRRGDLGSVNRITWTKDGTRLYYDRVRDIANGIFSIAVLGGDERLVLEAAQSPEVLPDGTLLAARVDANRNFSIIHYLPASGRVVPLGPTVLRESAGGLSFHACGDSGEVVFFGRVAGLAGAAEAARGAWMLNWTTGKLRRFAPALPLLPPLTVSGDGRAVLADLETGELHQVVRVSRLGNEVQTLLTSPEKPWYVSETSDGTVYVDFLQTPSELLRFQAAGGQAERITSAGRLSFMHPVVLPDGRLIVASVSSGHRRLLAVRTGEPVHPLLDPGQESGPPVALFGADRIVFAGATPGHPEPVLTIASLADGRIIRRLEKTRGLAFLDLAVSTDSRRLFGAAGGSIYEINPETGSLLKLRPGDGVAVEPSSPGTLLVQINDRAGVRLVHASLAGAPDSAIAAGADLMLSRTPIAGNAVAADGRIAVTVLSRDSWFAGPAILDPATAGVARVTLSFDGDVVPVSWGPGGSLLALGTAPRTELWRFRRARSREE